MTASHSMASAIKTFAIGGKLFPPFLMCQEILYSLSRKRTADETDETMRVTVGKYSGTWGGKFSGALP